MKFIAISVVLAAALGVSAQDLHALTNSERLIRGLSLLPPVRRATPVLSARKNKPSGIHNSCNTGPIQCCNSVTHADEGIARVIEGLFGLVVSKGTAVGVTCHPLSAVGIGGKHCQQQPVCCENNHFNGLIAVGCSPINING